METKRLPIKLVKDVLEKYELQQVIVLCKDKNGTDHFMTYGTDQDRCKQAAISADRMKMGFGWPEGSLSKYVTECIIPSCNHPMPHTHNAKDGSIVVTNEANRIRAEAVREWADEAEKQMHSCNADQKIKSTMQLMITRARTHANKIEEDHQ